eukprot:scaffold2109_cov216-Cylindrotheca_fusiformis.AAC.3
MNGDSSSSSGPSRRPQHAETPGNSRSILRQTPPTSRPSSHQTPRSNLRVHRSAYFSSNPSTLPPPSYGSPFTSPPPTTRKPRRSPYRRNEPSLLDRKDFDSPFTSPPPTERASPTRPEPLVLDPTKRIPTTPKSRTSNGRHTSGTPKSNNVPVVHKFFQAAAQGMRESSPPMNHNNLHATPAMESSSPAAVLARSATQAGFLQKLGQNIPQYKRRFFVLKPETRLYYYLSPNDTEPRGKIDLEGSEIEEVEHLPDGRYRFAIISQDDDLRQPQKRIVLEARTKEMGMEWIKHMEYERVSTLKQSVDELKGENLAQRNQIHDLEKQIENFRMIETDRDGALEDARKWKEQFEKLDEALRRLTQKVRKPPVIPKNGTKTKGSEDQLSQGGEEKKEEHASETMQQAAEDSNIDTPIKSNNSGKNHETQFPEKAMEDEVDRDEVEPDFDAPGTYFSALSNACQQQRELLRLTSIEATTAVEDVLESHEKAAELEKRMERAEKHLTKLWEENCSIRKVLKQKKREKRILVKEVKTLQQINKELEARPTHLPTPAVVEPAEGIEVSAVGGAILGSDEDKLIFELEEHVASSIRLHERLLAGSTLGTTMDDADTNASLGGSEIAFSDSPDQHASNQHSLEEGTVVEPALVENRRPSQDLSELFSPATQTKLMSLLDEMSDSHSEDSDGEGDGLNEYESVVSSSGATLGEHAACTDSVVSEMAYPSMQAEVGMSPERPNPLLELDSDEDDDSNLGLKLPKSMITHNGQATARLECPLVDVVESNTPGGGVNNASKNDEFSVYHITFYSKKIGIQFQKAPPAPTKPRGLLTDAMTADLEEKKDRGEKTASELSTIASIHSVASRSTKDEDVCPIADPKDVVLVCGFNAFEDSNANKRPKLGARLVAFDGISVEVGPWTFDSIRKGIQARGRPLTLSFRNDFLTTEQRAVLTKAVLEVNGKLPAEETLSRPPPPSTQGRSDKRPPSRTPSMASAASHESGQFVNEKGPQKQLDISDAVIDKNCCHGVSSASSSLAGRIKRTGSSASDSVSTYHTSVSSRHSNLRSFSEAGSSSISSAFAPLYANLMKGVKAKREKENYTPVYLQREPKSLDSTPQHQDFRSNLL